MTLKSVLHSLRGTIKTALIGRPAIAEQDTQPLISHPVSFFLPFPCKHRLGVTGMKEERGDKKLRIESIQLCIK